jgi:hypothetical protein
MTPRGVIGYDHLVMLREIVQSAEESGAPLDPQRVAATVTLLRWSAGEMDNDDGVEIEWSPTVIDRDEFVDELRRLADKLQAMLEAQ